MGRFSAQRIAASYWQRVIGPLAKGEASELRGEFVGQ
jgi:hypothetical protein